MEHVHERLRAIADSHFSAIEASLPADKLSRFVVFVEVMRSMDYRGIHAASIDSKGKPDVQTDLMYWGWNMAVSLLFTSLPEGTGIPIVQSSRELEVSAARLLQGLGKVSLLRRLADMLAAGIVEATVEKDDIYVRMSEDAKSQFQDAIEPSLLDAAEERAESGKFPTGWHRVSRDDIENHLDLPGAYWAREAQKPMTELLRSDIDELMGPLIKPWDSGKGIMTAYGATEAVDQHFSAVALEVMQRWRGTAGLSPKAKFGQVTGAEIVAVVTALVFFHAKHVKFVSLAIKLHKDISLLQSVTIWGPRKDLEEAIQELTQYSAKKVTAALDMIAVRADAVEFFASRSTTLIPLVFDLGNGMILRPVSSLTRNALSDVVALNHWRNPKSQHAIQEDREPWMRSDLYGAFHGQRYTCVPGNVKLRDGSKVLTDIDAVVLDRTTGDIGLFQLKWQDYSTNDVRQLRSKARNLANELANWEVAVVTWLEKQDLNSVHQVLRLKRERPHRGMSVFLFGISRSVMRTQGYGAVGTYSDRLAVATWPQLLRARMEIGPSPRALSDIHARLVAERSSVPKVEPAPISFQFPGTTVHIADLWNKVDDGQVEPDGLQAGAADEVGAQRG